MYCGCTRCYMVQPSSQPICHYATYYIINPTGLTTRGLIINIVEDKN